MLQSAKVFCLLGKYLSSPLCIHNCVHATACQGCSYSISGTRHKVKILIDFGGTLNVQKNGALFSMLEISKVGVYILSETNAASPIFLVHFNEQIPMFACQPFLFFSDFLDCVIHKYT